MIRFEFRHSHAYGKSGFTFNGFATVGACDDGGSCLDLKSERILQGDNFAPPTEGDAERLARPSPPTAFACCFMREAPGTNLC